MNNKLLILAALILAVIILTTYQKPIVKQQTIPEKYCEVDTDCSWMSINCCSENEGAEWDCIKGESVLNCTQNPPCYTYISPKPTEDCKCINNTCIKK